MTALFADTFYWIALADSTDSAHQRALTFAVDRATSEIVTTDEVLTEYFFFHCAGTVSTTGRAWRRKVADGFSRSGKARSSIERRFWFSVDQRP